MNKILKWAIEKYEPSKDDKKTLMRLLEDLDENVAERFVLALLGVNVISEIIRDIPAHRNKLRYTDGSNFDFIRYNYLDDEVVYEYDSEFTYAFKTEQDADNYVKSGTLKNYTYSVSEDYPYKGTRIQRSETCCSLDRWNEGE